MTHGMTHGERHARRKWEAGLGSPSLVFLDYVRNGKKVSRWKLFIWALNGLIPCMDDNELMERYGKVAFAVLMQDPGEIREEKKGKKKRKNKRLSRKKRRLMPSDYAWILRESGKRYPTVADPSKFYKSARSGHKHLTTEEREQEKQQRLQEWWVKHTEEVSQMKSNASIRRARKKLRRFRESIYNKKEQDALGIKSLKEEVLNSGPRTAFVRIKPELYDIIVCGECPVFIWKEKPGLEDMFQPNEYGEVKRVAVRPPGNTMKTPWAVFEIEWSRRKMRENPSGFEWVWEIGLGKRIKEDEDSIG